VSVAPGWNERVDKFLAGVPLDESGADDDDGRAQPPADTPAGGARPDEVAVWLAPDQLKALLQLLSERQFRAECMSRGWAVPEDVRRKAAVRHAFLLGIRRQLEDGGRAAAADEARRKHAETDEAPARTALRCAARVLHSCGWDLGAAQSELGKAWGAAFDAAIEGGGRG